MQLIISTIFGKAPGKSEKDAKGVVAEGGPATAVLVNRNNIRLTVVFNGELS